MAHVRRAAVLIAAPALKDHQYLQGVDSDLEKLEEFLRSANGGLWSDSEIHKLKNPTKSAITSLLSNLEGSTDYLFCHFGGHGHHPEAHDQTSLCINDYQEIKVSEIFPNISRQTLIIDACRKITREVLELSRKMAALYAERTEFGTYPSSCRSLFDTAIMDAEKGRIVAYSCSTDESADDALFTPALVAVAERWAVDSAKRFSQHASKTLNIYDAFGAAKDVTMGRNKLQNPEFACGRRLGYFPFAVA